MSKIIQNQGVVVFVVLYAIIVVCDLVCGANEAFVDLRYYTKPSILISLIIFFIVHRVGLDISTFRMTTAALIFSLAGDVFLLFVAIVGIFLYYRYKGQPSPYEKQQKLYRDQQYILDRIRYYQVQQKNLMSSPIGNLTSPLGNL